VQRPAVLAGTLALAVLAVGMIAGAPLAQTSPGIYEACQGDKETIVADDLPAAVEEARCPVAGRMITDNGVGSVLPGPGESLHVEALTTAGAQELEITRYADGTIQLEHVGDDSEAAQTEPEFGTAASGSGECSDEAYADGSAKVKSTLSYYFNRSTTPRELSRGAAEDAIRRGGSNIANTRNNCRLGDRVSVGLAYLGNTSSRADINARGCSGVDEKSEVSFGDLSRGTLATECRWTTSGAGYDEVMASDIKLNKSDFGWTTKPGANSCRSKFDLESVVTHERGHTFGLEHVSEDRHGELTMSPLINGSCQASERTLGKGDVLGLDHKYR
jgi:hypothetical protein